MKSLELPKLIDYIRKVVELEAAIYEQEASYSSAKANTSMPHVEKPSLTPPINKKDTLCPPVPPPPTNYLYRVIAVILLIVSVLFFVSGIVDASTTKDIKLFFWTTVGAICFGIPGIILFFSVKNKDKERQVQYQRDLDQYIETCKSYDEEFKRNEDYYLQEVDKANRKYEAEAQSAQLIYNNAKYLTEKLEEALINTKQTLQKYYDLDIIFPKYRNLVAMSAFQEYFETGRCTELTGPDGAYNLYESELRQNLIIEQLGQVVYQMEQIKRNQFVLYQELSKANLTISAMNDKMSRIMVASEQMVMNSTITAYCSQITAQNAEYLSFIATFG